MSQAYDVVVIGAGPAGVAAATTAAAHGLRVALLDEGRQAGGQVYRAPQDGLTISRPDADLNAGDALRRKLAGSHVESRFERRVWLVEPGFRISALAPTGPETIEAEKLIIATGALERHMPAPGWTLPGVMGLAAATILIKSHKILPGRKVAVAGAGPLLLLVAAKIIEGGGDVVAVIDVNTRADWIKRAPAMLSRFDLLGRGAGWFGKLLARRVPILHGHAIRRFVGDDAVREIVAGPIDATWAPIAGGEKSYACDAVCYGFGLKPSVEIPLLLGARDAFNEKQAAWSVEIGPDHATNVPGLYVCGDGAGVLGAAAAPLQGEIAALAAARDLGRYSISAFQASVAPLQKSAARAAAFGAAMTELAALRAGLTQTITSDTIVCRCEGLARTDIDRAIGAGATTINGLKSATRCGMGLCGGRVCEDAAIALIAHATGRSRIEIGHSTARPPLRPVPLDVAAGEFDYDSLPFPEPAPL